MRIAVEELRQKALNELVQHFPADQAERITDVLLYADMAGVGTMGVIKLTGTEPLQNIIPTSEIRVERETPVSVLLDGGANPAPLVAQIATDNAIEKASQMGMSIAAFHNLFSSTCAQAFYARRIAEAGLIGIVQSRPAASTAAFGGIDPIFGTNPVAYAFPTLGSPLVFDLATSAMTWYGLVLAEARGDEIPEGRAIDASGEPTTNPSKAMEGALVPFAPGPKAAGFAMAIELLGGVLSGSDFGQVEGEWGGSIIAIDPEILIGRDQFRARTSSLITKIRSARPHDEITGIRLPGERSEQAYNSAVATGFVDVDESTLQKLGFI